jgi:hypothetical protein
MSEKLPVVRVISYYLDRMECAVAEKELGDLVAQGYTIMHCTSTTQENTSWITWTLVHNEHMTHLVCA